MTGPGAKEREEEMARIILTGGTGFVGQALTSHLQLEGHQVHILTRRPTEAHHIGWDAQTIPSEALDDTAAVIHLAGENVAQRWSSAAKERIRASRVKATNALAVALAKRKQRDGRAPYWISASAVGIYGPVAQPVRTESSPAGPGFLADVCQAWEQATAPATEAGVRVGLARIGLVLGQGGLLSRMMTPFRMGVGGRVGSGQQGMSWVHLSDVCRAFSFLLAEERTGPFNFCAPNPCTNADFTRALGRALRRPAALPLPAFAARTMFGREMADEMLLGGALVQPAALSAAGFTFSYEDLEEALARATSPTR